MLTVVARVAPVRGQKLHVCMYPRGRSGDSLAPHYTKWHSIRLMKRYSRSETYSAEKIFSQYNNVSGNFANTLSIDSYLFSGSAKIHTFIFFLPTYIN